MFQYLLLGLCLTVPLSSTSDNLSTQQMIKGNGYPVETHPVQTEDGYILELHRIPGANNSRPPVLILHGIALDSAVWVLGGPKRSLGYLLADEGYDVWLGNPRGNTYSRKHVSLSPDNPDGKFWEFSWHEIGVYDLPAMIDYILKRTGHKDLIYIGYSQGATSALVMGSERPNYNSKIRLMVGLGPAAYFNHTSSSFATWNTYKFIHFFVDNGGEVFSKSGHLKKMVSLPCTHCWKPMRSMCAVGVFAIVGEGWDQLEKDTIQKYMKYIPSSISIHQIQHYVQVYNSGEFRQYDFGLKKNIQKYGQKTPPKYKLSNVTIPTITYYGMNDILCKMEDVKTMQDQIANPLEFIAVPYRKFNHMDFVWAKDVKTLLYNDLIRRISKF